MVALPFSLGRINVKLKTVKDNRNKYDRTNLNQTNEYVVEADPTIRVFKFRGRWVATRDNANRQVISKQDTLAELRLAISEHLNEGSEKSSRCF